MRCILCLLLVCFFTGSGNSILFSQEKDKTHISQAFDSITVIASKYPIVRGIIPASLHVISQEVIRNSTSSTVLELVNDNVPGLMLTQKSVLGFGIAGKAAGAINIRGVGGMPNSSVLVLIDGRPDFMGIYSHPLPDAYPMNNVEKVEVVKGPVSVLYGTNAMGGVINIITKTSIQEGMHNSVSAEYGSFNTYITNYTNEGKFDKFKYYASAGANGTDGHRKNSDYRSQSYAGKMMYNMSENFDISVSASTTKYKLDDPGTVTVPTVNNWFDVQRNWFDISLKNKLSFGQGEFKLHANTGEHKIYDGFRSNDKTYGFLFYQHVVLTKSTLITGGFDYKKIGGKANNVITSYNYGGHYEYQYGPYVLIQQYLSDAVTLSGGLRAEKIYTRKTEYVPQAGLIVKLNPSNSIRIDASKGFRAPSIMELYLNPPSNTAIEPERLWNYELGYSSKINSLSFDVTGYVMEGSNLIQTVRTPAPKYRNTGKFTHRGIETNASLQFADNFSVSAGYSWLYPGNQTQYNPKHKIVFNLHYSKDKFSGDILSQGMRDLYGADNSQNRLDSFVVFNAKVSYALSKNITLFVKVNNVINERYQLLTGYPMPGRYGTGGIKFIK